MRRFFPVIATMVAIMIVPGGASSGLDLARPHPVMALQAPALAPLPPTPPQPPVARALPRLAFPAWLAAFKQRAIAQGISAPIVERAFQGVQFMPRVIVLDHRQPEVHLSFNDYITRIVSDARIDAAEQHMADDHALLTAVSLRYGVQPAYIVALWGMETDFGAQIGNFPIISALATLAYDGRRAPLFTKELLAALRILDRLDLAPEKLRGSWAGAMGQTQFMPSSFLNYAVDYTGDGFPDIWTNKADVLASIANYLSKSGWDPQNGWGLEVALPSGFDSALIANLSGTTEKTIPAWQDLGVRAVDGGDLPQFQGTLRLVQPGGASGPTLLVTDNYRVLLKWNRSLYFATAVSYLADRIDN